MTWAGVVCHLVVNAWRRRPIALRFGVPYDGCAETFVRAQRNREVAGVIRGVRDGEWRTTQVKRGVSLWSKNNPH